jgi:hypothetical protein
MQMMNREQMIEALTRFELEYLLDYPELLKDAARFFANGGFSTKTDQELRETCADNVWLEFEGESNE